MSTVPPGNISLDAPVQYVKGIGPKTPNANILVGFEAARTSWIGNIAMRRGLKTVWDAAGGKVLS